MFSGIIEEIGEVESFDGERLCIGAAAVIEDLSVSESIAINGACLTVVGREQRRFTVEVVPETLRRTNLGGLRPGDGVNLERPLRYGGRIGGHFVQGHVDGIAHIAHSAPEGNSLRVWLKAEPRIMRYVVEKGFIALDGTSLTVVDRGADEFSVALIPYTREHTIFGRRGTGDGVNVEVDVTAKYVEQFTQPYLASTNPGPADSSGPQG